MRCCVCTVPAMQDMLDHQMKRGMGLAQCTEAACFMSETEAGSRSVITQYIIIFIIMEQVL